MCCACPAALRVIMTTFPTVSSPTLTYLVVRPVLFGTWSVSPAGVSAVERRLVTRRMTSSLACQAAGLHSIRPSERQPHEYPVLPSARSQRSDRADHTDVRPVLRRSFPAKDWRGNLPSPAWPVGR